MAKRKPVKTRPSVTDRDRNYDTYRKTGVFRETVNGQCVGYFVGWRYHFGTKARNIREGLYFSTPEAATQWRDSMEATRVSLEPEHEQIA